MCLMTVKSFVHEHAEETVASQTGTYDMEYLLGSEHDNEGEPRDLDKL